MTKNDIVKTVRAELAQGVQIEVVEKVIQGNSYLDEIHILNSSSRKEYQMEKVEVEDVNGKVKVFFSITKDGMILFPRVESEDLANSIFKALK